MTTRNNIEFEDREGWRYWLQEHHASQKEAWLVLFKKGQGVGLSLDAAVEEALCYGWIDGKLNPLDERRYALRFSPRKADSVWSISNIQRVERLAAEGKMTPAGQQKIDEARRNGQWQAAFQREQVDLLPAELEHALDQHPGALSAFQELPDSRKKQYFYWLELAKREKTRQQRIQKIIDDLKKP